MKNEVKQIIHQEKIIAIMRNMKPKDCIETAKALYNGGIRLLEIPFFRESDTLKQTTDTIRAVSREFGKAVVPGAGTVTTLEQLEAAWNAGAKFFLSPVFDEKLIAKANEIGMVAIPGAMTPTEILEAYKAGADFVKIFPAGDIGSGYFKSILAPLRGIPLLAVGGVNENNMVDFMNCGAVGVGIGNSLIKPLWVRESQYSKIKEQASVLVKQMKLWKGGHHYEENSL